MNTSVLNRFLAPSPRPSPPTVLGETLPSSAHPTSMREGGRTGEGTLAAALTLRHICGLGFLLLLTACCCVGQRSGTPSVELFNGRDLTGWQRISAEAADSPAEVWTVKDGMIICRGEPIGFLHSERQYTNFRLLVEYRWAPGSKPGNSGIFSRITQPMGALPRCVEIQLMHGNAGDVLGLQGRIVQPGQPRFFSVQAHPLAGDIAGVKKTAAHEKPPGEWNRVEMLAQDGDYTVWVNGELVNEVSGVEVVSGPIGLQSEGGEIHFRRVTITPF